MKRLGTFIVSIVHKNALLEVLTPALAFNKPSVLLFINMLERENGLVFALDGEALQGRVDDIDIVPQNVRLNRGFVENCKEVSEGLQILV